MQGQETLWLNIFFFLKMIEGLMGLERHEGGVINDRIVIFGWTIQSSTHKWFRKYGESSVGQRLTSSPQKITLIAKLIFRRTGMRWPTTGPTSCFMLFPDRPNPVGNQANQGTEAQSIVSGPVLEEPALVCGAGAAAHCSPVAHFPETRPPLSGKWNDLAPQAKHIVEIVLHAGAVGKGSLPFHALGLCSSYSSLTCAYKWTISGQEQPGCSFLEGV